MLLHMDFPSGSPGLYGTTVARMLDGIYAQVAEFSIVEDPDPNVTGNVVRTAAFNSFTAPTLRKVLPASAATVGFACRLYLSSMPVIVGNLPVIFEARNGSNESQCSIRVETDGRVSAVRGNPISGAVLGTSAGPAIIASAWQHIETKIFLHASTGTVEVRVEGVVVLNLTGQNTLNTTGPCTQTVSRSASSNSNGGFTYMYLKDMIWWDTTGAFNNDFMGSCSVKELIPDGDVALNWALTGSVTGYGAVNEASPNDDTSYIYAVTPAPAADLMSLTNLPVDVTSVRGLMVINRSKNTDGGDGKLQMGLVSGASTQLYTDRQITTAYTYWTDISETDPATAAAWLPGAVNAMNLRLNRTL